ncbi:MAG: hypothetical protein C0404_10100 [Verrucomicrobia bacterium]|nr:hypothetical protein [Verrucomicrobiota bacterium]
MAMKIVGVVVLVVSVCWIAVAAEDFQKPYSPPCVERESVFEFTEKPAVKTVGPDKYEITFAVKGNCDVTVGIVDTEGRVVRHLGAGVLGANAPAPFQKSSLKQAICWNGKDDLEDYVKEPPKMRVKVSLGLKPEFDKRLGGTNPKNIGGFVFGMAASEEGVFVITKGHGSFGAASMLRFDHDGNYVAALVPPPANLPESRLTGYSYVEYEKGVKALHGPAVNDTVAISGFVLPGLHTKGFRGCQPAIIGNRIYFCSQGANLGAGNQPSLLFFINSDGGSEPTGLAGAQLIEGGNHPSPRLAASPDGKWIYMIGQGHALFRKPVDKVDKALPFIGDVKNPGSDDAHFNGPVHVACDGQGRVYVADPMNGRIQVFTPDGKFYKGIKADRPELVAVHRKTGEIYVEHLTRIEGKTVSRITKYASIDNPQEVFHIDGFEAEVMALDSWAAKPRLWVSGRGVDEYGQHSDASVTVWEDDGKTLKKIVDFDQEAKQEAGENYMGRWTGGGATGPKIVCDPVKEILYYGRTAFDLKTGNRLGVQNLPRLTDDFAIDKKGYFHCHSNPGFYLQAVIRGSSIPGDKPRTFGFREVPYDYGVEAKSKEGDRWLGILPTKDQPGAKFFQDGIGVNMRGDVVEQCNIYYTPKMEDAGVALARAGINEKLSSGQYYDNNEARKFERYIEDLKRLGEDIYSLPRQPGLPIMGATEWVFDAGGKLKMENAVLAGGIIAGAQIDEDGSVYFVNSRIRLFNNEQFLTGRAGVYGDVSGKKSTPLTGVLVKSKPNTQCKALVEHAVVSMEPVPARPADTVSTGNSGEGKTWYDGAEWIYAGAVPIRVPGGCSCPTQRIHTDWYKRTFVPEAYRHSVGVLDTAGNLILHVGQYGNFDSGNGPKSKMPVGGDGIGMFLARFLGGTDNYVAFDDRGERLVVLKLNYHAEETAGIGGK